MIKNNQKIMFALNALMAMLFLFAAVVQYNDPDSLQWISLYGGGALACLLWTTGYYYRIVPVIVFLFALGWLLLLLPEVVGQETVNEEMFNSFKMNTIGVEQAREIGGLSIMAVWMGIILFILPGNIKKNPN